MMRGKAADQASPIIRASVELLPMVVSSSFATGI